MKAKEYIQHPEFIIQWHITERCNWYCKHCYQETRDYKELPFKEIKFVFKQCLDLFRALRIPQDRAHINIGGGEPLLRKDFFKILALFKQHSDYIKYQIMTNGSLITDSVARDLAKNGVRGVQVSLEGLEETNDKIRGKGSFQKIINAIKLLRRHNIEARVSLTLTKMNLDELEDFSVYLKPIGVSSIGMRRYVPVGRGKQLERFMLSPLELRNFYLKREELRKLLNERGKFFISHGCEDAIFFSQSNSIWQYHNCSVTTGHHLTIFSNGDILACRRCPIVVGNVLQDNLLDVYFSSDKLWSLRNLDNAHPLCRKCPFFKTCLGGAKCVTFAYFKTPFAPDPQCWRLFKKLPEVDKFKK